MSVHLLIFSMKKRVFYIFLSDTNCKLDIILLHVFLTLASKNDLHVFMYEFMCI